MPDPMPQFERGFRHLCSLIRKSGDPQRYGTMTIGAHTGIVTAIIVGVGVMSFEGNRRDGSEMVKFQINDQMVSFTDPPTPKVAVAPAGASPFRAQSYGYSQFGLAGGLVMMDP